MRTAAEFLIAPLAFSFLAVLIRQRLGSRGLLALATAWVGLLTAYSLASAPPANAPLHDFERTPLPVIVATIAGTVAAAGLLQRITGRASAPVVALATGGVYAGAATLALLAAFAWALGVF